MNLHTPKVRTVVTLLLFAAIWCASCYNSKKATEQVDKALTKYPETAAKQLRDRFPCVPTTSTKTDSSGFIALLKTVDSISTALGIEQAKMPVIMRDTLLKTDTLRTVELCNDKIKGWQEISRLQEKAINDLLYQVKHQKPIHDTTFIEDSAKIYAMSAEANRAHDQAIKQQVRIDDLQAKAQRRGIENWIWRVLCLLLIVWKVYGFFKLKN